MGKKNKTREQKIASATRHHRYVPTYSLPIIQPATSLPHSHETVFTVTDLQKTFYISSFLVCAELILYLLINQHIIKLPYY